MAAITLLEALRKVNIVVSVHQHPEIAGAAITAGDPVRYDSAGLVIKSLGTSAPNAVTLGIATKTVAAGEAVTVLEDGELDGYDLSALAYGDPVYLQDAGGLGTTAGTVSKIVGYVKAGHANVLGSAPGKILNVKL